MKNYGKERHTDGLPYNVISWNYTQKGYPKKTSPKAAPF
jgi:hypothetical protein